VLLLVSAQCSKRIGDGSINMTLSKKKTYEHTHELINMNHTNIPIITLCEPQISKGFEGMLRFMMPLNIWCMKTENRGKNRRCQDQHRQNIRYNRKFK
jgi:hypothetical protein